MLELPEAAKLSNNQIPFQISLSNSYPFIINGLAKVGQIEELGQEDYIACMLKKLKKTKIAKSQKKSKLKGSNNFFISMPEQGNKNKKSCPRQLF